MYEECSEEHRFLGFLGDYIAVGRAIWPHDQRVEQCVNGDDEGSREWVDESGQPPRLKIRCEEREDLCEE